MCMCPLANYSNFCSFENRRNKKGKKYSRATYAVRSFFLLFIYLNFLLSLKIFFCSLTATGDCIFLIKLHKYKDICIDNSSTNFLVFYTIKN